MPKPFDEWTILPHGKLNRIDDNLLTVTGLLDSPLGKIERRMTVVRLADGNAVVYSAIALGEAEMSQLEAFGNPAYLIVPNDIHRMDCRAWKQRYPGITVIAPPAAREKVEEVVAVNATAADFGDPAVRLVVVPGTAEREIALVVKSAGGTSLVLNDIIFDFADRPGLRGMVFKAMGMTGDEPHIPPLVKRRQVKDEGALKAQLEDWSHLPDLQRVIISHGGIIANDPAAVLDRIARELAA